MKSDIVPVMRGRAFKFGDHVDTDQIIPARYLDTSDISELSKHCMAGSDENFSKKVKKGDIIIAGRDFGCGSSREHAPLSIKGCGVAAVVAVSFARIFFRNAINIGLPIVEIDAFEADDGDELEIDLKKGQIKNLTKGNTGNFKSFPEFLTRIISAGGLMEKVKEDIRQEIKK